MAAAQKGDPLREHAKYFGSPCVNTQGARDPTDAVVPQPSHFAGGTTQTQQLVKNSPYAPDKKPAPQAFPQAPQQLDLAHAVGDMCDAAFQGNHAECKRLLDLKASASLGDYDNRTPLHLAACGGSLEICQLLVEHGARLEQDRFGCLPIHDAVRYAHVDVVSYLRDVELESMDFGSLDSMKSKAFGMIVREGIFAMGTVQAELDYFFDLGFHESYFEAFTMAKVSHHIHCLVAAKCMAQTTDSDRIESVQDDVDGCSCIVTLDHSKDVEATIAQNIHDRLTTANAQGAMGCTTVSCYLVSYVSAKPASRHGKSPLVLYQLDYENFPTHTKLGRSLLNEDDVQVIAPARFLRTTSREKLQIYQRLMAKLLDYKSALVEIRPDDETEDGLVKVFFGTYEISGRTYVQELCQIFRCYDMQPTVFSMESFANGAIIYEMDFPTNNWDNVKRIVETLATVPFLASIPKEGQVIVDLAMNGTITFGHAQWMIAATKFCFHFFPKETPEYLELREKVKHDTATSAALDELYLKTIGELIQEERIYQVFAEHHKLMRKMYDDFKRIGTGLQQPFHNKEIQAEINRSINDETNREILLQVLIFNASLRMTNVYKGTDAAEPVSPRGSAHASGSAKNAIQAQRGTVIPRDAVRMNQEVVHHAVPAALSFRLDPSFLATRSKALYPEAPYAIFIICGRGFYGFHVRFRDVARGGIRLIRSRNEEVYKTNAARLFEENYNLAYTQQKKNKDIPEGGSKGTILLATGDSNQTDAAMRSAFLGYIDSLLDCMLPERTGIYSWLAKPELLFFGPDENTANLMDLGARRAFRRGYRYWKAITTGKSTALGGIPHDVYGMTTNSVHMYVLGLLEKLGLQEEEVYKTQTAGPDGDLGSNEILISKDKTTGMCDGSGTLFDPSGLDRDELERLALARLPVAHFNRSKLGPGGFLVLIEDMNVTLPDGTHYPQGVKLRDTFHLSKYAQGDLFVPCGGRPNAVHASNVQNMFIDGAPKFKYIVEGANLFFTTDARKVLEEAGVKIFKDASTNKGGVTSSSLEVFASLCMDPHDHQENMTVEIDKEPPAFYQRYAADIVEIVKQNARMEFDIIWDQMQQGTSSMEATDLLSGKINQITDAIFAELTDRPDDQLMETTLQRAIPPVLLEHVGYAKIVENTPPSYLMAICATWLASRYVYDVGLSASEFSFYQFMATMMK